MLGKAIGKSFFKLQGWTINVNPDAISDPKQVAVGFPHTTNYDGVNAIALFLALGLDAHVLVKQELFKNPVMGKFLTTMGCIPVDRDKSKNVVQQMVDEFAKHERFTLAVAPEATRTKDGTTPPIRTGFWHIAKATNVPIALMMCDTQRKVGGIFAKIYPSDSMEDDLLEMQRLYAEQGITVVLPTKQG
jgi:1-acyl-sn-glycerol-3-phosphate acyltransferase